MKQKLLRSYISAIALMVGLTFSASAQQFVSESGSSYNASCRAVLKFKQNDATPVVNNGTANEGTVGNPIDGTVEYASSVDGQTVLGLFYEKLVLSGGKKTVITDVSIVGQACNVGTALTGYLNLETYPYYVATATDIVTYQGIFNYASDLPQTIYPEYATTAGTDMYNTLNLSGTGIKTIGAGTQVGTGTLTTAATTPLEVDGIIQVGAGPSTVSGTLTLNLAASEFNLTNGNVTFENVVTLTDGTLELTSTGNATFDGDVDITAGSIALSSTGNAEFNNPVTLNGTGADITLSGAGNATFGDNVTVTEGSLVVADNAAGDLIIEDGVTLALGADGIVDLGIGADLVITGSFTNSGNGTNLIFDCASIVTYNGTGGQTILGTVATNPYGNLLMSESAKTAGDDIYLCTNFSLSDGNLDMDGNTLYMTSLTSNPYYGLALNGSTVTGNGLEEVLGKFNRVTSAAGTYRFNNNMTDVTLTNANLTSFELNVLPGTNPNNYDPATDVNRKVNITYSPAPASDDAENFDLKVGYRYEEGPIATTYWDATYTQASIRMWEGNGTDDEEKIGTGVPPVRTPAVAGTSLGAIKLSSIGNSLSSSTPNSIGLLASTNDVILRSGPTTFYSVNDGRWTNPNTWDEGEIPHQDDNAEVRTVVYVGIDGVDGTSVFHPATGNQTPESTEYGTDPAANKITIANLDNAALIIGNEDNGSTPGYVFKTKLTSDYSFVNNNTRSSSLAFPLVETKANIVATDLNGLWLMPLIGGSRDANDYYPILSTQKIQNKGAINNEGMIELGQ